MRVKLMFKWYDFWVGAYWSAESRTLYICPLPMLVVALQRELPEQAKVWCPECGVELVKGHVAWQEDPDKDGLVRYWCQCGSSSQWDFDAPVPLLVRMIADEQQG